MPFDGSELSRRDEMLLNKLAAVTDLLRARDGWCKRRLRMRDGRRCILGALMDLDAKSLLADAILGSAREVTGRPYNGLEGFNDDAATDHRLVLAVLERTRENILLRKVPAVRTVTVARRVRTFYSVLARLER